MYTVRRLGVGQMKTRQDVLKEAVTYVLERVPVQPFPQGTWTISPESFDSKVSAIILRANSMKPSGMAPFQSDEGSAALIQRGYKPGVLPIARKDEPAPPTISPILPPPVLPLAPAPVPPPANRLVNGAANRTPGKVILPVIVPPSPTFPIQPPAVVEKKSPDYFLWIAGLLALYVFGSERVPHSPRKRSRRTKPTSGNPSMKGLSGKFANCLLWKEVESRERGGTVWRCMTYGPTCNGQTCQTSTRKFQTRTCVKTKTVPTKAPRFKRATVQRCAKYEKTCLTSSCLPETQPKPEPSAQHGKSIKKMAKELAQQMAEERNEAEETAGKSLGREILERGGLRPYKSTSERSLPGAKKRPHEEFEVVPLFLRRKTGKPMDEMASEMGFEDDSGLLEALEKEYSGAKGKKKRRWSADDFMIAAEDTVSAMLEDPGYVGTLGQDLFPGLKRELVLQQSDIATSDDPLDIHLQRKGWKLPRVRELQASISEKMTPDMFTGKTKKLSAGEVELQRDITEHLDSLKALRKKSRKVAPPPGDFWIDQPSQPSLLGLSGMSNDRIAEGVRKAVKEDGKRKAHGDTSLRAFYITPDLDIVPWKEQDRLSRDGENVSVHSHSAENYNYLRQLTGKREPASRFSVGDLGIFRTQITRGLVDTDALIMGDGRMYVLRCGLKTSYLPDASNKSLAQSKLPKNWYTKAKYKNLSHPQAAQKKQREYLQRKGCSWTETYWKDPDAEQPMLFHLIPRDQQEFIEQGLRDPVKEYTIPKGRKKPDLTKAFSVKIPRGFYPADPAQQELFTMPQRKKTSTKGEKRITMGPKRQPVQIRLLGGNYGRL